MPLGISVQFFNYVKEPGVRQILMTSGRRSLLPVYSALKPLRDFFGNKTLRSIKVSEIEGFKKMRLTTPTDQGNRRKVASVNRELEVLRAIFNFALQNEWLIKNPFALSKGLISKAAEVVRDRVLNFDDERRLLFVCTGRRKSFERPLNLCIRYGHATR